MLKERLNVVRDLWSAGLRAEVLYEALQVSLMGSDVFSDQSKQFKALTLLSRQFFNYPILLTFVQTGSNTENAQYLKVSFTPKNETKNGQKLHIFASILFYCIHIYEAQIETFLFPCHSNSLNYETCQKKCDINKYNLCKITLIEIVILIYRKSKKF